MKTRFLIAGPALALALVLGGCGRKSDDVAINNMSTMNDGAMGGMTNDTASTMPMTSPAQSFANTAAASDMFEVESSKLALSKSSSASVKKFADMMVKAHTESTEKLKTAAGSATPPVVPNAALSAEQQATMDKLNSASGSAFDTAYIAAQTDGHQKTLDALRAYSASGDVPALKTLAGDMVPTVTAHLNMAKGLKP
ncbi:DUF4142 domain-containing protein [Sphingobium xenophagum]|uniref:DUF4142 domain-containing protein n=1 Tax=Sphingobium xenophagum TaxID=121428 RepID=UPI001C0E51C7|nr:DUF4142 domain-containing protein [Sphingobium xenophagum]QWT16948.1 DUF4142 domain-containing protein [Sphingobium xenophagum]